MTVLLLAGSGEAVRLAAALDAARIPAIASLAGATRDPNPLPLATHRGGFGGAEGFVAFLESRQITAVVDATHPFAARITDRTARICAQRGLPYLQVLRPAWTPQEGDVWTTIQREEDAAAHVTPGQVVFLGTGRQTLERFANLPAGRVICRRIDPPRGPFPFAGGEYLVGRPPFPVADEVALFRALAVDWLIVKNAGGAASATKLTAARELGIPVLMIARPPMPDAARVGTVDAAMAWIAAL